jgi:beta-glucosidase-like glycosyl hydrolase
MLQPGKLLPPRSQFGLLIALPPCSFNRSLIRLRGLSMGQEHVGKGVNVALGPMMNMGRQAQGGRNWEGFGADPFLSGEAAYETILGMQVSDCFVMAKASKSQFLVLP